MPGTFNLTEAIKLAISGANKALGMAEQALQRALNKYGEQKEISYPNTAYELPLIFGIESQEIKMLSDISNVIESTKLRGSKELTLENMRHAGIVTLVAAEIIEALKYLDSQKPYPEPYTGFISDGVLRQLGVSLVDGSISGIAVIFGKAKDKKLAVDIVRELQEKQLLSLLVGQMIDQIRTEGVELGLLPRLVPLGDKIMSAIHSFNFAVRVGLTFGNIGRGERTRMLNYLKERVPAFILALGELDELKISLAAGAIACGFPVISDQNIPQIDSLLIPELDSKKLVSKAIDTRGIKVKIVKIPIPISYGSAFEGERIRKSDTYVEIGGRKTVAFELLRTKDLAEINDGKITFIGKDLDKIQPGTTISLAIIVDVAGKKMESDFEPVLERRIHDFINYGMGIMHVAQRDLIWIRISKDAVRRGFRIKNLGDILHAKLHSDFPAIVDKVEITIFTEENRVLENIEAAREIYRKRDERIAKLTDESVDTFYSCTLCQSFAPNHVCIITPERLGLCGAINWLDAKAGHEITPSGPNQPIEKGEAIDKIKGQWKNVNEFVKRASHGTLKIYNIYSLMEFPMTSCGCFECVVAILPETNGVMIVNREYNGDTPSGMKFSTLAGSVGGGVQTPGFMGIGKRYIVSRKFIAAEGGIVRIVWMPSELKKLLENPLKQRCKELGLEGFIDKIADETITTNLDGLLSYMRKVGHPAL
ncbi:MAG TPA: CO dehydrogenase/CO-methylating acetyl-CoA synthase complex subunit beta, partial [bacterium (Candidatus Stahlbacteria)]|nr:CO dehydrogenase/CO-methylating acetyl-CoA synthase complex subunit beta [Candidatus Stahlbacteria bacterium]